MCGSLNSNLVVFEYRIPFWTLKCLIKFNQLWKQTTVMDGHQDLATIFYDTNEKKGLFKGMEIRNNIYRK